MACAWMGAGAALRTTAPCCAGAAVLLGSADAAWAAGGAALRRDRLLAAGCEVGAGADADASTGADALPVAWGPEAAALAVRAAGTAWPISGLASPEKSGAVLVRGLDVRGFWTAGASKASGASLAARRVGAGGRGMDQKPRTDGRNRVWTAKSRLETQAACERKKPKKGAGVSGIGPLCMAPGHRRAPAKQRFRRLFSVH